MSDPRQTAASIVGAVDWQTEVSGFCRCPGEALHTQHNGKKDCRVNVDGAPTIYCFHSSCGEAVAAANRQLRQELGNWSWEIALPGGRVLRSGDILQRDGSVKTRAEILGHTSSGLRPPSPQSGEDERMVLATIHALAERFKPELFELFHWPFTQIVEDSPLQVHERDAEDQFRTWLRLWPAHCHVWIGDVFSSGNATCHSSESSAAERRSWRTATGDQGVDRKLDRSLTPKSQTNVAGSVRPASLRAQRFKAGRSHG